MAKLQSKIAYCIITYNHPEIVKEVLDEIVELFCLYRIDIYVYDSSENDATCEIIHEFSARGFDNLYHIKLDASIGPASKLIKIFSGFGLQKKYKYIWPAKDRTYFKDDVLKAVISSSKDDYDCIFLGVMHHPMIEMSSTNIIEEYSSREQFFLEWSWLATSIDVTIYKYDTMLFGLDLEKLEEQYFWDGVSSFIHTAVLFHMLANISNPKIKVLSGQGIVCYNSRYGVSSWKDSVFQVWASTMVKTIEALPDCYNSYKERVIKKIGNLPWIFGSHNKLVDYQRCNILTKQVFEDYKDVWSRVSDISVEELQLIMEEKYEMLFLIVVGKLDTLLENGQYDSYCQYFFLNTWMEIVVGNRIINILVNCCNIYLAEKEEKIQNHILVISKSVNSMIKLYLDMVDKLKNMVLSDNKSTCLEVLSFRKANSISIKYFIFLILNESENAQLILDRMENYTI